MHTLVNAQDARNMQTLAGVAESLLTTVNGIPPERFLEFRMRVDGGYEITVKKIVRVDYRMNINRIWLSVEFTEDTAIGSGVYDIWVVGAQELTGSF